MPVLIGKLDDLVFDRRAITRADAGYLTRVQRRFVQVIPDRVVDRFVREANIAIQLPLINRVS